MNNWFQQQVRALAVAAAKLARAPFATLFNVSVLGVALALPAGLYVGLANLQSAAGAATPEPQLTVFMALDATREHVRDIDTRLKNHAEVAGLRYVARDKALEELTRVGGLKGVTEGLSGNPLPDAFVVDSREGTPAALERLRAEVAAWPKVGLVQVDTAWAQRLDALLRLARLALLLLATVLGFALVTVTFNTIRLQILTQRDEIEVAGLIGATAAFIRRPFLYHGTLLGLLAGLLAWGVVAAATAVMSGAVADVGRLYGGTWQMNALEPRDALSLLVFAGALGWLGAWLSVTRHLVQARPM